MDKKLHLAPVSLTTVRPDFLQDFTKLVTALMDPDPERCPRAVDVARACSDLLEEPSIRGTSRASTRRRDLTTEVLYRWDENDV